MKLTEICIQRPVLATVLSFIIIALGIVAFEQLQVRQYPRVDFPKVSVTTQLEGASPLIIESTITKILEDALSGIEGLKDMRSKSATGDSRITMTFDINRDIDSAVNDVRDKIGRVRSRLPEGVVEPLIKKADADAIPIIHLALTSDQHSIEELADYAYRFLQSQLESLSGVSSVDVFGGGEFEMKIILDPVKMANFNITPNEVARAIKTQNIEKPAGNIKTKNEEILVTIKAPLITERDFDNIILGERKGALLRLKDIGKAELVAADTKSRVRFNDKPAISMSITKQSVANPLTISQQLSKELPNIKRVLPNGMNLEIASDKTIFVERSIKEVYQTIFEATFLVIIVVLLFLRSLRAVIIPIVTIPVSLIGTFFLMQLMGFSLNILTLLALVLAIGMVVDDAIVMLENIYRYIEEGMKPIQAAFKGAKEISFAIIAMTITLAAVYAPITMIPGTTGKLFTEFAMTLAGSVIISGVVALTLSPMMCGRLLKAHKVEEAKPPQPNDNFLEKTKHFANKADAKIETFLNGLDSWYGSLLETTIKGDLTVKSKKDGSKKLSIPGSIITIFAGFSFFIVSIFIFKSLKDEYLPREDQGQITMRSLPLTNNANIDFVDRYVKEAEKILKDIPEMSKRLSIVQAPGESNALNLLVPWEDRSRSAKDIAENIRLKLYDITGLNVFAYSSGTSIGSSKSGDSFDLVISSTDDFKTLSDKAQRAMNVLNRSGYFEPKTVEADIASDAQEYIVTIDREKAAILGIDLDAIRDTLDTLVGGKPISKFKKDSKLFSVRIEVDEEVRQTVEDLTNIYIKGSFVEKNNRRVDKMVPLSEVINIEKTSAPVEIGHIKGSRAITISARLKDGFGLGEVLEASRDLVEATIGDSSTQVSFSGSAQQYLEESQTMIKMFTLALVFIFMVLAAQYESWRDPWIIILSVPLSLAGAAIFLKIFGQTSNIYSQIGFLTLIGLITKHGILIVDFANSLKEKGMSRVDAVIQASRLRLRPILMTTFAMVFGALPLALAGGAGMESRQPIGLAIVGGMFIGTIFTLFVLPAVYTFISRKTHKKLIEPEAV